MKDTEQYIDAQGVPFEEHRALLSRPFPRAVRVTDRRVRATYRAEWDRCQVCLTQENMLRSLGLPLETHHIMAGTVGRSDERTNLIVVCRSCHEIEKTVQLPLGAILWCKWRTSPADVDWVRLAVLRCRFLPDLIEHTGLAF